MAKAGCTGSVIGTQLYSLETGRCKLGSVEVTIAVFESAQQRDEWIKAGQSFNMTAIAGEGWAAGVAKRDTAGAVATAFGGKVV